MAAATYTTDLTDLVNGAGLSDGSTTTNWVELTGYTAGGGPAVETDFFIQGTNCISQAWTKAGLGSLAFNGGTAKTIPTDGAALFWWFWASPPSLGVYSAADTGSTGGVKAIIGSSASAFKQWDISGNNYEPSPYGGWINFAINPTVTADDTVGAPTASLIYFGITQYADAQARGQPFAMDIIRYGRCEARIANGDLANGYATFAGFATTDASINNRWALIQSSQGSYVWKGLMVLGYVSAVDFRDSNKSVVIAATPKVTANFNRIEIRQATSRVDWTGISITALGTVSRGQIIMVDNATFNVLDCTFTDLSYFTLQSGAIVNSSVFRRCGQVAAGGATLLDCTFDTSSDTTGALLIASPAQSAAITYCTFNNNIRAIKITAAGTYVFSGHIFSGGTYHVDYTGTAAVKTITGATTVAGVSFTFTSASHGYTAGQVVVIKSVVSSTGSYNNAANEYFTVSSATTNTFTVLTAQSAGTYTSGGTATIPCLISPSNNSNVSFASCLASGGGYICVNAASYSFSVTNIIEDTEVRIFKQSDLSELAGAELVGASPAGLNNVSVSADPDNAGRFRMIYTYPYFSDTPVYVVAFNELYQALRPSATLKATNASLQIAQSIDRQYDAGTVP